MKQEFYSTKLSFNHGLISVAPFGANHRTYQGYINLLRLLLRLIYDKSKFSPSKQLFEQSNILPIKYRIMYRIVCLVYKSLNRMTPDYLTDMFKPLSMVSQRQARSTANMDLWVPNYKLSISRCGLKYTGAHFYNMLPPEVRFSSSFPAFKRRAKKLFLDMFTSDS